MFVWRLERVAAQIEASEYLAKFSGATGTWSAHLAADPDVDWPALSPRVHRGTRHRLQPAHDPDRVPRLAGRAVRPGAARRRHPAQSRHRRVDLHLARLLLADPRRRGDRLIDDAAQDQPDPVRERRGEPRDLGRPARDARRRRSSPPACSATSPTPRRSATSASPSGTRCSRSTTCSAGSARSRWPSRCWMPTSTRTGRCSPRRSRPSCAPRSPPAARRSPTRTRCSRTSRAGAASAAPELAEFVEGLDIGDAAKQRLLALTPATYTGLASQLVDEL